MQTVLMQTITRVARIYLGQTQAEFAKAVNLTQPDLCELEQKTEPYGTIFKYQRISEYLGIGVDVLLRNDFTAIPESFFEKFPPQPYKDAGNSENHSLGRKGEDLIFQRERERVAEGYPTLAKLVLPLYKMEVASPGFDILTFDELGVPYAIEVKTSALSTGAFNLTGNEYAAASAYTKAGERYILTTISGFGTDKQSIQDTFYSELRHTYRIQPAAYRCYPLPEPAPITGIAYYRRLRGMTQKEFAQRMNMPSCNLSSTATGNRGLTAANYLKAADILETTVDALLQTYTTLPELDAAYEP